MTYSRTVTLWLPALCVAACASPADDSWVVVKTAELLRIEDGEDEYGPYANHYLGLILHRNDEEIVLVYQRWPDDLGKVVSGDRVRILTDLATLEENHLGYSLEDVSFSVVSRTSDVPRKAEF